MVAMGSGTGPAGPAGIKVGKRLLLVTVLTLAVALIMFTMVAMDWRDDGGGPGPVGSDGAGESRQSGGDDECLGCHSDPDIMPGVYQDWSRSRHAEENVTCIDCHEGDQDDPDVTRHNGYYVTSIVSPLDCADCHPDEVAENDRSLHALGSLYYELLFNGGKLPYLESQIDDGYILRGDEEMDHAATLRGCQACHGTNMTGKTVDDWTEWPNNGIGRINPDGSMGSCSACHSRHAFSVEEARKPETCGQCHMGPDHPQIEIYTESKHGNIYQAEGDTWNWTADEWEAGEDYRAPTCAACHMSAAPGVATTHDVGSRLSWELEPAVSKHTDNTANSLGLTIGDGATWQQKRDRMKAVCGQCHSETWVDNYYDQADLAVELYNIQYSDALETVNGLYDDGLLTPEAFDEPIEFKIYEMWHHEGRRARMGSFMQGPDYVQWHGFYELLQDRAEIEHMAEQIRAEAAEPDGNGDDGGDHDGNGGEETSLLAWSIPIALLAGFLVLAFAVTRK